MTRKSTIHYSGPDSPSETVEIQTGEHSKRVANELGPSWLAIDRKVNPEYSYRYPEDGDHMDDVQETHRIVLHTAEDFKAFLTNVLLAGREAFGDEPLSEPLQQLADAQWADVEAGFSEIEGTLRKLFTDFFGPALREYGGDKTTGTYVVNQTERD